MDNVKINNIEDARTHFADAANEGQAIECSQEGKEAATVTSIEDAEHYYAEASAGSDEGAAAGSDESSSTAGDESASSQGGEGE